jgi:hypothetical protein
MRLRADRAYPLQRVGEHRADNDPAGFDIGGSYKGSTGTMMCPKLNDTGEIACGAVRKGGLSLRLILPDGSSCIFQSKRSGDRMAGGYICLQDAAIVERGQWDVERIY